MKTNFSRRLPLSALCAGILLAFFTNSVQAQTPNPVCADCPEDPDTFLTLLEKNVVEDDKSAAAYYDAIDPDGKKTTYRDWLFETGFIADANDFAETGPFALNADASQVLHKNVADLNFVRLISSRCEPDCDDPNPDIYSTIENYLTFDDAADRINRLASVTMEWGPAVDGSMPSDKFVTYYAFTGAASNGFAVADSRNNDGAPFAPNLDGRGGKQVPGLCNSCHGGVPKKLNKDGTYKANGDTRALFLPLDLNNFEFDPSVPQADQEDEYKTQNQMALITHRSTKKFDEEAGFRRFPAGHELIEGWYGGPGMPNNTFNGNFVAAGWLPPHAPLGVDELYAGAIAPACRSCHANQKRELDFGTYEGFLVFEDALGKLVLDVECGPDNDNKDRGNGQDNQAVMPLALETYKRFWELGEVDVFKDHIEWECEN